MITEIEGKLASCWKDGTPELDGLYLFRFERCGNPWYFLLECVTDPDNGRMLYLNHKGGGWKTDYSIRILGDITHYCDATGENFGLIMFSLAAHTFNKKLMKYE